jgi:hypothetical protein
MLIRLSNAMFCFYLLGLRISPACTAVSSNEPASEGDGGEPGWTCESGYDLASYEGDRAGLCPAQESVWSLCCDGPATEIIDSLDTRCAPDNSACVADSVCSSYRLECGWVLCDPVNPSDGPTDDECDWEKAQEAFDAANRGERELVPCATDKHCASRQQVCNRRFGNRMFCDDP